MLKGNLFRPITGNVSLQATRRQPISTGQPECHFLDYTLRSPPFLKNSFPYKSIIPTIKAVFSSSFPAKAILKTLEGDSNCERT